MVRPEDVRSASWNESSQAIQGIFLGHDHSISAALHHHEPLDCNVPFFVKRDLFMPSRYCDMFPTLENFLQFTQKYRTCQKPGRRMG